jgi:hypothetical protein
MRRILRELLSLNICVLLQELSHQQYADRSNRRRWSFLTVISIANMIDPTVENHLPALELVMFKLFNPRLSV